MNVTRSLSTTLFIIMIMFTLCINTSVFAIEVNSNEVIKATTDTEENLMAKAKESLQTTIKSAKEILDKFNQIGVLEYVENLKNKVSVAVEGLNEDKYTTSLEIEQTISNIKNEMEKIGNVNSYINKIVLLSQENQIFNVQENFNCSFQFKLPVDALANYKAGNIESSNIYIDNIPVDINSIKFTQTSLEVTTVELKENYIKGLEIGSHTLTVYPFGNKNIEISVDFVTRQVAKYETMRVGSKADFVPMNITEDDIMEWNQKEKIWSTSNQDVISIEQNGTATANNEGQAEIKATYSDGTYDLWIVSVEAYNGVFATEDFGDFSQVEKGNINWINVKKSGIDFVVLRYARKADNGIEYVYDEYNGELSEILAKAQEQGIKTGIMLNCSAHSIEEAEEEANFLIEKLKSLDKYVNLPIGYNVMLYGYDSNRMLIAPEIFKEKEDCADSSKLAQATPIFTEIISSFANKLKKAGYDTMIYFSKYSAEVLDIKALQNNGIGLMYYYLESNDYSKFPLINETATPDIWFYVGDRYVEGVTNEQGRTWMLMGDSNYINSSIKQEEPKKESDVQLNNNDAIEGLEVENVDKASNVIVQKSNNPATGDNIVMYFGLCIVSLLALSFIIIIKK